MTMQRIDQYTKLKKYPEINVMYIHEFKCYIGHEKYLNACMYKRTQYR